MPLPWRLLGSFSAVLGPPWAPRWGVLGRPEGILELSILIFMEQVYLYPKRSKAAYPPPRLVLDEESRVIVSDV